MNFFKCAMDDCKIYSFNIYGWLPDAKSENFICVRCRKYLEILREEVDASI